ncbi:MAG: carboxy terminal-processing peptidase [Plesiomonas sp.]|uniref:carboxy terminal-processing peptidase n=1 Tax=Plesiomonas sp. TaxID=2486279 RepID=UPI003EE7891E
MKNLFRVTAAASILLACWTQAAEPKYALSSIPVLTPEMQHSTAEKRITARFTRSHYRQFDLNSEFSDKIFDRYLKMLDYNHNVFLQSDIALFSAQRDNLNNELKEGKLDTAYALFNLSQKRRYERYQYALTLLDKPMRFDGTDVYDIDRTKTAWPKNTAELDKLWYEKVKFDALSLKLAGKEWPAIQETLTKRYNFAIRRLAQTNSEDVFSAFMNAFSREIDPHTSYLSPRNAEQFNNEMNLSLEGIGAVLQADDDYTVIRSLVAGGPASTNKSIAVGDKIIGVGQAGKEMVDVIGWRLDDVVDLIKGPKGSKVRLQVLPAGKDSKAKEVVLVRDKIRLEDRAAKATVKEVDGQKVGVIDIPSFYVGLSEDVKARLQELRDKNVAGVVVDLRGNGGGALTEATALSGLFIPQGPVVQVRDSYGRIKVNSDTDGISYYDGPLTVLVDRFSASASEIFAAAMQDYGRALIVGENTFGKGTVQQHRSLNHIYDLFDKPLGHVQYTIQKFYRINGGSTQHKGVAPDIVMPTGVDPADTGESFEDNALPWDSIDAVTFDKAGSPTSFVTLLTQQHQARIAKDPEFAYILDDIAQYKILKAKENKISLNLAERQKENHEEDALRLKRVNERLVRAGKKPVKSLDAIPKDYQDPDPYMDETVKITLDLAKDQSATVKKAS